MPLLSEYRDGPSHLSLEGLSTDSQSRGSPSYVMTFSNRLSLKIFNARKEKMIARTHCSSREPRFHSQPAPIPDGSQVPGVLDPGDLTPLLD